MGEYVISNNANYNNKITDNAVSTDIFENFHNEVAASFKEVQRQYIEGFQEQYLYDFRMKKYLSAKIWKNAIKKRR